MIDLNDLRVFAQVAAARSFSDAARHLQVPKSSASRAVARLEEVLGVRLFQRTTRDVVLTAAGDALWARCRPGLGALDDAVAFVADLAAAPRGLLRISAGIGFGINFLSEQIPAFLRRYPEIRVDLDLTGHVANLLSEGVDIAVRLGPLPDSSMVAVQLGTMPRYLCAAPDYAGRHGLPSTPQDIAGHDVVEMPSVDGRPRCWNFSRAGAHVRIEPQPRIVVNEALTIQRMILHGAGLGVVSGYLCGPDLSAGRLLRALPEWSLPGLAISLVFPSRRELTPAVRAFVDHMKTANGPDVPWRGIGSDEA